MKFLHLSDLHIGKRVNEFSMIEDQKYILKQILSIAEQKQVDAVVIAGDIYDKSVPSAEAVQVFDWFLTALANQQKKVFAISGNHDSAERIAFGAQLMSSRDVYVSPVYDGTVSQISLTDAYGEIVIYLLPFIKPAIVRHALENEPEENLPESYQDAVKIAVDRMDADRQKRNILLAHQFVTGAGRCDSEDVSVGGLDNVDAEVFDAFDYVALGHIHSPQSFGKETVRYCGTPLKYSFSEANQKKSVTVVEMKEKGQVDIDVVPLRPLHDMHVLKGTYLEIMAKDSYPDVAKDDYIKVILTDEEDIVDGMQKLRTKYPNLMQLDYDNNRTRQNRAVEVIQDVEQKSEMELFEEFYKTLNNQPMSKIQREFILQLLEEIREG